MHYKVTPPARDRNAAPFPLTPNSVLIVTMDAVSEIANDSKVPTGHPITFVLEKNIYIKSKQKESVEYFRVWRKILWNRFKEDKMFETEPEHLNLKALVYIKYLKGGSDGGVFCGFLCWQIPFGYFFAMCNQPLH